MISNSYSYVIISRAHYTGIVLVTKIES